MNPDSTLQPVLDKRVFEVVRAFDEKAYWLSRSGVERLRHIEVLQRINDGSRSTERLQRVFEIAEQPWG